MRAIGYVRVSTEEQATTGVSLATQTARIASWADLNGYPLHTPTFADAGLSGAKIDRPGLAQALAVVRKGDALVVHSLSRLSRSTRQMLDIADHLLKIGADLVSISEKIDTTSASGRMVFRMMAVLNEFERDQISERVSSAMQYKKSKGELVGGVPYGKTLLADGITLVDNDAEQAVLSEARCLHRDQLSLRKIAVTLAAKGFRARNGKVFAATQIMRMVS